MRLPRVSSVLMIFVLVPGFAAPAAAQTVGDASVWDSNTPQAQPVLGIGGSGQINGEFVLDTFIQGGSAIQVGLRGQERFVGPTLARVGNVYFASPSAMNGDDALWNFDWHLDFGTRDADTAPGVGSLETALEARPKSAEGHLIAKELYFKPRICNA